MSLGRCYFADPMSFGFDLSIRVFSGGKGVGARMFTFRVLAMDLARRGLG